MLTSGGPIEETELPAVLSSEIEQAVAVLRGGGVVAFPTETYYGLAVDPFNEKALRRLFLLKNRPFKKPVLTLVGCTEQLSTLAAEVPLQFEPLISRFWPGPLTLIFQARRGVSSVLTADTGTIGVRFSSHPVAREIVLRCGIPITATSANLSGGSPARTKQEVFAQFGEDLDLIVGEESTPGGCASTIIGASGPGIALIRAGAIPFQILESSVVSL